MKTGLGQSRTLLRARPGTFLFTDVIIAYFLHFQKNVLAATGLER